MPRYFFHLSFGERTILDEEGVDLPSRSAARAEATASIRELTHPKISSDPRRWASWFLQVADDGGPFLRLPIGYPALEIVRPDTPVPPAQDEAKGHPPARRGKELAELLQELRGSWQETRRLVERGRELHTHLSSLCAVSKTLRIHSQRAVRDARLIRAGGNKQHVKRLFRNTQLLELLKSLHSSAAAGRLSWRQFRLTLDKSGASSG